MRPEFFSMETLVRDAWVWCDLDDCTGCDGMNQTLFNLSREENR